MSVFWAGSNPQRHLWPGPALTPRHRAVPFDASGWPSDRHGSLCCVQRTLQESRKEPLALPLLALGQTSPFEGAEGSSCIWNQPILGVLRSSNVEDSLGEQRLRVGATEPDAWHRLLSLRGRASIALCSPAHCPHGHTLAQGHLTSHIKSSLPPGSQIRKMFFSRHAAPIPRWSVYFPSVLITATCSC